ncbi:MAG TPA: hypothetical protein VFZ40_18260 [Pyrinomonadaceae bacterium]
MKPPVVLATLVLDLPLALPPPVVAFAFAPPPVVLTLTPRSLFPAAPVFAVAGRPVAIAGSIIRPIAVAPIAIRPVAPVSIIPAALFFTPALLQKAPLLFGLCLLMAALHLERPALLFILATLQFPLSSLLLILLVI